MAMKLTTARWTHANRQRAVTAQEAVQYVADHAEEGTDGQVERLRYRTAAVEGMLGRLLTVLVDNGKFTAEQLEHIFDHDVSAEE